MNLLDFRSKIISSDSDRLENDSFFSEEVTMFNILNGSFRTEDIVNIHVSSKNKDFSVNVSSEEIAKHAEDNLDQQIIPGAYYPLYRIMANSEGKTINFKLDKM